MATYIADRYRILKKDIGGGNMSTIHLCDDADIDDEEIDSTVIIKMFDKASGADDDLQEQVFKREVESLMAANHDNVVRILDHGFDSKFNAFYIALEYVKGKNLKEAYPRVWKYDYAQKIELVLQIIEGLDYLHKKGIVHRDIKPANIMIGDNGIVKIIDFGISRLKDTFYSDYTLAQCHTVKYSSPEQLNRNNITSQSDIFSLGLVLYEIFADREFKTRETIDCNILPDGIQAIVTKMIQMEIDLRYLSLTDVKRDIEKQYKLIIQNKYLYLVLTNNVAKRLHAMGYIDCAENTLSMDIMKKELSGKCYMATNRDKDGVFDGTYIIYGRRFASYIKHDQNDSTKLIVTGLTFPPADKMAYLQETCYEIPYGIKVNSGVKTKNQVSAEELIEELLKFEEDAEERKEADINAKDITKKWNDILELEKKKIEKEKLALKYVNCKINEEDYSLEIDIDTNTIYEINYTPDDMLQMTQKKSIFNYIDVGHMREFIDGHMIIDLAPYVDLDNIAESGEISISMRMAEIAIQRQRKALKSIKYKENANPNISEIIFNPSLAKSRNNVLLRDSDCKSKEIDQSKLKSLEKAHSAKDLFLLQGPPGTGKTTFISELVYQILNGNDKVKGNEEAKILIASQSHVAVDHSLSKIKSLMPDIKMIRVGVIDKMSEASRDYTLDIFCREWTKQVIEKCKEALEEYKKSIGIDDSLQEKNSIVAEIDSISSDVSKLEDELEGIERRIEQLAVIETKWTVINEKIESLKNLIADKSSGVMEEQLIGIMDTFTKELTGLNGKLGDVIEESIELSDQKEKLDKHFMSINDAISSKYKELEEWQNLLGVSSDEDYEKKKKEIQNALKENGKKYAKYSKVESLCNEWQKRVTQGEGLLQESLADATLVGATCLGIASLSDNINLDFDWVIVDEAGKATPAEIMVPICLGKKVILVGDHKQLPPVVDEALLGMQDNEKNELTREDLEESLFEYLESRLDDDCKGTLNEQYRMNPVIGDLISELFYDGKLVSRAKREDKTIPLKIYESKPLVWLTTAENPKRREEKIHDSYMNSCEAKIIFDQLLLIDEELTDMKMTKEVAIIAGYRGQKDKLNRLYESNYKARYHNISVEINTVDAFQGRETDIVFYSLVRSNDNGNLGFLKDVRRLNVAFSRAKELLVVVGDHHSAQLKMEINNHVNPFVHIISYINNNTDGCLIKEI